MKSITGKMTRTPNKTLTRRQNESLQILMKALTDFVLEDKHEDGDISDHGDQEASPRKTPERGFDESILRHHLRATNSKEPRLHERLTNKCKTLVDETERLEYSLRTVGSGGSGMYGAWLLRRSLYDLMFILENVDLNDPYHASDFAERYALGWSIDNLSIVLSDLARAFSELETFFKLDFMSEFHSVNLSDGLQALIILLSGQYRTLHTHRDRTYISPEEGQHIRMDLDRFFVKLDTHLEICTSGLFDFRRNGTPLVRSLQGGQSDRYLSITTIATFFSAVTSATLQISFQEGSANPTLTIAVNTFFFSSLIFSTAAAVHSLLAMTWQRSFIRLPKNQWASSWLSKTPLMSLIISGAFFAIGLCLFVFSSQQSLVASVFTVTFAGFHALGIIAMSIWFVYEQWEFRRHAGVIGQKLTQNSATMSLLAWIHKLWQLYIVAPVMRPRGHPGLWGCKHGAPKSERVIDDLEIKSNSSDSEPDFKIEIKSPSSPGSVVLPASSDIADLAMDDSSSNWSVKINEPVDNRNTHEIEDTMLDKGIVDEPIAFGDFSYNSRATEGRVHLLSGTDGVLDRNVAIPTPESADHLTVRRETWEQNLHQDSISHPEMHNRANPTRRRVYPPFDPPA
ncbi:hypothetical protein DFH11DRAFT_842480 [Phellopilus nigrolimitatus]|nr:hypothetical protein DFH11DRAFT_842480 [Phellopilus nigrolimitatus]